MRRRAAASVESSKGSNSVTGNRTRFVGSLEIWGKERAITTSNVEMMAVFSNLVQVQIGQCLCVFGIKKEPQGAMGKVEELMSVQTQRIFFCAAKRRRDSVNQPSGIWSPRQLRAPLRGSSICIAAWRAVLGPANQSFLF